MATHWPCHKQLQFIGHPIMILNYVYLINSLLLPIYSPKQIAFIIVTSIYSLKSDYIMSEVRNSEAQPVFRMWPEGYLYIAASNLHKAIIAYYILFLRGLFHLKDTSLTTAKSGCLWKWRRQKLQWLLPSTGQLVGHRWHRWSIYTQVVVNSTTTNSAHFELTFPHKRQLDTGSGRATSQLDT